MKIKNESVSIKIGNKERCFKNLILDNYIELFRESFLEFKDKTLDCCFIKFNSTQEIDKTSTTMEFDVALYVHRNKIQQTYIESTIVNKYVYEDTYYSQNGSTDERFKDTIENHIGDKICGIGFGKVEIKKGEWHDYLYTPTIYAFLDVSKYNIIVQDSQPILISRVDKIKSDLLFFPSSPDVECPYHLSVTGKLVTHWMDYNRQITKFESIGFGNLNNVMQKEILAKDLNIKKEGIDTINIGPILLENEGEGLYPSPNLYPSKDLYTQKATPRWIIYKFKIYEERLVNPDDSTYELVDTGLYYYQSQYTEAFGKLNLKIKYERS